MALSAEELKRAATLPAVALVAEAQHMGPTVRDALEQVVRAALARLGGS